MSGARTLLAIDLRSAAAARIALGVVMLADLLGRLADLDLLYSDGGVVPRSALLDTNAWPYRFSIHNLSGLSSVEGVLIGIAVVCALAFLVGFHTRASTIVSWLLLVSLHNRNPFVLNGGDHVLRLMLFWGMFLPLGARFSVDARRAENPSPATPLLSTASAAILLQLCLVYAVTGLLKLMDASWRSGDALGIIFRSELMTRPFGYALLSFPTFLRVLSWSTLALEVIGPFLLFMPRKNAIIRTAIVAAFIFFHVALAATMYLDVFAYACIAAWLIFLPGDFWDRFEFAREGTSNVPGRTPNRVADSVVTILFALVFVLNVRFVHGFVRSKPGWHVPDALMKVAALLRLDQRWAMFVSPKLLHYGWLSTTGTTRSGAILDLSTGGKAEPTRPSDVMATWYPPKGEEHWSTRWSLRSTYLTYLLINDVTSDAGRARGVAYATYLCRKWNRGHRNEERLTEVEILYRNEPDESQRLITHACGSALDDLSQRP